MRKIIKRACNTVELPYFNPHALRKTLALMGDDLCKNTKQRKAWSQNLGHEKMATTDQYYGKLEVADQFAALNSLRDVISRQDTNELLELVPHLPPHLTKMMTDIAKEAIGKGASA